MSIAEHFRISEGFPKEAIETCIREALKTELQSQQVLRPRAISACEPEVDSLVVVEVICAIEEVLGIELPTSFAPRGGFEDVEACVSSLLSETKEVWDRLITTTEETHA